ncbi:MAG: hypothetical protein II889_04660 [Clostridia bacterium]|nr:hypothetical protein [Clostridia bacterium]
MKHLSYAILILASVLLLAACSPMSGRKDDQKDPLPGDGILDDSTLGDRDGDGHVEDDGTSGSMNAGSDEKEDTGAFTAVEKVKDADDAVNFIGANVYSLCRDSLPVMTRTRVLSNDDMDALTYSTELEDTDGISDVIVSESALSDGSFSVVMLRTDGTNTESLARRLAEGIDPEKWDHASAGKAAAITLDDDIVLVMGDDRQVDDVIRAVTTAAADVYDKIGEVRVVLG